MKVNHLKLNLYICYFIMLFILSYFVATRELTIGTDTISYKNLFFGLNYNNLEVGYRYFNIFIYKISKSFQLFLFIFYFTLNFIYIKCLDNFIKKESKSFYLLVFTLFLSFLFLSPWYQSATLNALRQGYSLVLMYLALSYFFLKCKYKFLLFLMLSCSFHSSSLIILPFLLLLFCSIRIVIPTFILISIFYPLGINEEIVKYFSTVSGIPLYYEIISYSEKNEMWKGFQLNFYIYSMFWCFIFSLFYFRFNRESESSLFLLKVFIILTCYYFVLGFGSYSNRFAFASWFLLPLIQAYYLAGFIKKYINGIDRVYYMILILFIFGVAHYYLILRPLS